MSDGGKPFNDDLALAQACLAGDAGACAEFERRYFALMVKILMARGAAATEADELARNLLSDCVVAPAGKNALLGNFNGQCPLQGWLATCGTRRFINLKRREKKRRDLSTGRDPETADPFHAIPATDPELPEAGLTALLREALAAGFRVCRAENRLMLRLVYIEGLSQREIGRMWNYHESTVSHRFNDTMDTIREATLARVREIDPYLTLTWQDFLELCQSSSTGLPW